MSALTDWNDLKLEARRQSYIWLPILALCFSVGTYHGWMMAFQLFLTIFNLRMAKWNWDNATRYSALNKRTEDWGLSRMDRVGPGIGYAMCSCSIAAATMNAAIIISRLA